MGDAERFDLELERVRLRAMLVVERSSREPSSTVATRVETELDQVDKALAPLRAKGGRSEELAARLSLGPDEIDLVWTAVAAAIDPRLLAHLQLLGGNDARRGIPIATHCAIAGLLGSRARALVQLLSGPNPLLDHRLLTVATEGQSPAARVLAAPARLCTWLAGEDHLDPAMAGAGDVVPVAESRELDDEQRRVVAGLRHILASPDEPVVVIEGLPAIGRRSAVAAVARELGRTVVSLDLRRLPREARAIEEALWGLRRECLLRPAIALVACIDELTTHGEDPSALVRTVARMLDELPGPVAVTSREAGVELTVRRPLARLAYGIPEPSTRGALWRAALAGERAAEALDTEMLAIRYRLGPGGIRRAVASARLLAGGEPIRTNHIIAGVRANIAERLGDLAQRVEVRQSWDDLVLAPDMLDQAKALIGRVRHSHLVLEEWGFSGKLPRGTGVAALFSGPPGTGKTMLAGIIARELDLELYQVDLSKVVSKWVGETEKQLSRIFEAAEAGHALLLFDEADALFSKRTEVKGAIDRYANLEVNYLLQRIESFGGVTILTTNLEASIDPALKRRLACHIAFWPPEVDERVVLWRRLLASRAPIEGELDLQRLAERYSEMTGANIRNAVLSAAFLAAAERKSIGQDLLDRAARGEYAAMGRVLRSGG